MEQVDTPAADDVRKQVDRLERSEQFAGSGRLIAFLRFVVDQTLTGAADSLKEAYIGNAVYGREPPYDPRIDSTVRVEARRLRRKLDDYYATDGIGDAVRIGLPTGGYVPVFVALPRQRQQGQRQPESATMPGIFEKGPGAVVAVMPFRALSANPAAQAFANGLTDEIIFALGRASGIRIISRSIVFQYQDKPYTPALLSQELGANAVLQGTVRVEAELLRVTIEVSNPQGMIVWSDRFDPPNRDHLRWQEKIAHTILSRVQFDSSKMRSMQLAPGPVALEANAKIYRARRLLDLQTPAEINGALALFREVADSAPDYARGYTGIADCYCDMFRLGLVPHAEALEKAKAAAEKALTIDSESAEAYSALGVIAGWLQRSRPAAQSFFEKALRYGSNARASRVYGVLMTIMQRHEEAELLFRESREVEPISSQQDIAEAVSHYQARRFDILRSRDEIYLGTTATEVLVYRALASIFDGDSDSARLYIPQIALGAAKLPDVAYARAEIEAWLGEPERARRQLTASREGATGFARATLAASVGEYATACAELGSALDRLELSTVWMRTDRRFDEMREMAEFKKLMERLDGMADLGDALQ